MVKTHNITGLKYLCQTSKQDPYKYKGSGIDWKIHLNKFGFHVNTEILAECYTKEELTSLGRYYSKLWNIVDGQDDYGNKIWANRIPETGGGATHTPERKELFRQQQLGKKKPPRTKQHTERQAATTRGKSNPKTAFGLRKYFDSKPDRSSIVEKQSTSLKEWYQCNPNQASKKANKTWDSRVIRDYEKYKTAVSFIVEGKTNRQITKLMKIDSATINKLRSREHRVFSLFPVLIELMGAEVL